MKRNTYPFIHLLRALLWINAFFNVAGSILFASLFIVALRSGNDEAVVLGMGFAGLSVIPAPLLVAVLSVFMASMLKLFVDIQDNTWETANQMRSFATSSKQQPRNPPDGPIQIDVD